MATPSLHIALTGATGFVGRHLVARLLAEGHEVSALVRDNAQANLDPRVKTVVGDLSSAAALAELMSGADVLIHVAGAIMAMNRAAFFDVNAGGCQRVAEAAQAASVKRVILVSSLAARAPEVSDYAASKRAGEEAMQAALAAERLLILRPAAIYGPGDIATIPLFKALTQRVAILPGRQENRFSLIHVSDFANIIVGALSDDKSGVHEIDDGHLGGYNWQELMTISQGLHGHPKRVLMIPKFLPMMVAWISELIATWRGKPTIVTRGKIAEIYHAGGWVVGDAGWPRVQPIEARVGFAETFAWYMARGVLSKRALNDDFRKDGM